MRIAVLDVGSDSAHLTITDLRAGEPPRPVARVKHPTRLAEAINRDGAINGPTARRLVSAVQQAVRAAEAEGTDQVIAFATSAVRDATNREEIIEQVASATGVTLGILPGEDEARLTFLAARAWYGWSAGQMLLLDIGGGSLEIAVGDGTEPAAGLSLPLGAGRLTREHLPDDPPRHKQLRRLHRHVDEQLAATLGALSDQPPPVQAVATSKTFTQLAKLTGAPKAKAGPYAHRVLDRGRLRALLPRLAKMTDKQRAKLRGVSKSRARQVLAGAVVAEAVMTSLDLESVHICPWTLREGITQRRLQTLPLSAAVAGDIACLIQTPPHRPRQRPELRFGPPASAIALWLFCLKCLGYPRPRSNETGGTDQLGDSPV
ncbi:MAG: hypothetical protein GEV03_02855 [Streptosporangiales bacterium]|nr:hypothetical protein [Streptosporangiales bacterium]